MYKHSLSLVSLLAACLVASFATFNLTGCFDYADDGGATPPLADDDDVADDDTGDDDTGDDDTGDDDTADTPPDPVDEDGDGYSPDDPVHPDCDDADPDTYPGAPEMCDGKDNDCNGAVGSWFLSFYVDATACSIDMGNVFWHEMHVLSAGGSGSYEFEYSEGETGDKCVTQYDAEDCITSVVLGGNYVTTSVDNWENGVTVHLETDGPAPVQ